MTILTIFTSNNGSEWRQIIAVLSGKLTTHAFKLKLISSIFVLSAAIASFIAGLHFSWSSPSIPKMISEDGPYNFTLEQCSYLTIAAPIGIMISGVFFASLIDKIGRKYSALIVVIPYMIAFIIIAFAESIYVFYIARFIVGIGDAGMFSILPTYIGEITTPKIRGTWGNCVSMFMYIGQTMINVLGGYTTIKQTALICLCFPVLFLCTFSFSPESPYYYIMKGEKDKARKALQVLRQTDNVDAEMLQLESDIRRQMSEPGTWKDLFMIKSNRRALLAGMALRWFQQLCGISVFSVYTQYIFQQAGGSISAVQSAIIFQGAVTLGNVICAFFLDKIGRRNATISSLFCCALVLTGEAVYFYISLKHPEVDLSYFQWMPLVGMLIFVPVFSFGLGIVPTLMLGELFSASIKGKGLCMLNINLGLALSTISKAFQMMETKFGLYSPFTLFAASCFINTAVAYYVVPETKGKTLEEIQQDLRARKRN